MTGPLGENQPDVPLATLEPLGIRRDRVTRLGYGVLATWAWFLYGFGAVLPLLRAEQGASRTVMGLHSAALATGALVAGGAAVPLVRRLRRRGTLLFGALLLAAGVLLMVSVRAVLLTLPAVLLIGIGGAVLVNTAMPALAAHHGDTGAAVLSEANAVAAGVGLLAPLAVGLATTLGLTWRPAALATLPLVAMVVLFARGVPSGTAALDETLPARDGTYRPLPRAYWVAAALVVACVGIEFCCTAWSADLLRQRTGMSAGAASAGLTCVVGGMAVGRTVIGRLALRMPARGLLVAAFGVTVLGWSLTWVSTVPAPALVGLTVIGLGIAGQYPLAVSLVYAITPGQRDQATGMLSYGVGGASGLAPFVLGALADRSSTHAAFTIVPALVLGAGALLWLGASAARRAAPIS